MKRSGRRIGHALLTGALVFGAATPAAADGSQAVFLDETAGDGSDFAMVELEDEALHRFIDAAHDVQAIRRGYADRIRHAGTLERRALRARARDEMRAAIERQGLDVTEYRAIGYLLENEGELIDRLEERSGSGRHG